MEGPAFHHDPLRAARLLNTLYCELDDLVRQLALRFGQGEDHRGHVHGEWKRARGSGPCPRRTGGGGVPFDRPSGCAPIHATDNAAATANANTVVGEMPAAAAIGLFALRLFRLVKTFPVRHRMLCLGSVSLTCQVGIHCGPVVGAIIGAERKAAYDVFGDTVNTASRLMSTAPKNTIRVSSAVHRRVAGRPSLPPDPNTTAIAGPSSASFTALGGDSGLRPVTSEVHMGSVPLTLQHGPSIHLSDRRVSVANSSSTTQLPDGFYGVSLVEQVGEREEADFEGPGERRNSRGHLQTQMPPHQQFRWHGPFTVEAKGKGLMTTYGLAPAFSHHTDEVTK
eukprot:TRINITY_DN9523_c0_g1_i1.p1 TRINITY_DN9523_c0_g1~~TRINITY_DN9523_c0_g1_i1.p1  ORF type:complete len:338 (-),score=41.66 TRINITY_DN9523_c0_g1_i1:13-1026(-)